MFCPNCGKDEQTVDSYCRACGEWLPDMKKSVSLAFGGSSPEENIRITLVLNAIGAIICFAMAIALCCTYYGAALFELPLIALAATFFFVLGIFQASNIYALLKLRRGVARRRFAAFSSNNLFARANPVNALPVADTGELICTPASVTEHSTELLEPVLRNRKNR